MANLEELYPSIIEARAAIAQGSLEHGIDIYCEILKEINPESASLPYIYIEYADALIKNCNAFFMREMERIVERKGVSLADKEEAEDDLENAWNLLEICKQSFTILKDYDFLASTWNLLGEICMLNNKFDEAIHEFAECLETMKKISGDATDPKYADVYLSMARSYEFLGDFEMSKEYYNKAIVVYRARQDADIGEHDRETATEVVSELLQKVAEVEYRKERSENVDLPSEPEDGGPVVDINACKRSKK
jgi:tetratricopeptide (TPR) repeat protein